ncbi:MAG: T9SS type A sorting domain-containing protein [Bacteroidetes bacterium]|nr:T9SS type A sorting domain-containing protein [Bacteroidota bacterium]
MKKLAIGLFLAVVGFVQIQAAVTFNLNTSTAPGFTDSTSTVVLRGSFNGWSGAAWEMTNVGGDYWTYQSDTLADGSYEFKYVMVDDAGDHWESSGNRALTVSGDVVLPTDYWENGSTPPYTETDSTDVWFRVSTAGISDYDGETMYIAGSMNGWSGEALSPEGDSTFWSGQYSFSSGTSIEYKFLHDTGGWESNDNRTATVTSDTTLAFVYWNNAPPTDLDPVNVTFNLNTSTAPGFTDSTNTLVVRGSMNGWAGNDWELTNVGGDYWSYTTTSPMAIADYEYKFVMVDELGNDNWESTDNRLLSLANATTDVSIWLDYWENGQTPPYTPTDSTDVWFRVSTAGVVGYDGETMHIAGTMNGWGAEPLTQEGDSEFWSGQYSFSTTGAAIEYKFLVDSDGWESIDNRTANVTSDTTLAFVYWDNAPPVDIDPVTKTVIFSVDMSEWLDEDGAEGIPLFSVARGDTMQVRGGFNGWNCDDPNDCVMSRTPGTNIFSLALTLTDLPDHENEYKFYLQHSAESMAQFVAEYGDMYGDMGWEDSPQFGGSNRIFQIGEDDGTGLLELSLSGYYDLPAGAVTPADQEIALTFSVDMTGADSFESAEDSVFLVMKDKWLNYFQGFGDYSKHYATDNGDGTYSVTIDFMGPIPWHMIYTWGFYDVSEIVELEEGGGFGFGRFRARYHHSNSDRDCAWEDFAFEQDTWQADPPLPVEDYDPESICIALEVINDVIPSIFALADNYPNPFNPTTNISFSIPMALDVQINIYNVLGQRVATFNEGQLNAGIYNVRWNGRDQIGNALASGIYFYELQAGDQFRKIKKMTLLK